MVYGHGGAQVQAALGHEHVEWIPQAQQLGTGHAVMQAMAVIPDSDTVLVLYGDVPLIRAATLNKLVAAAAKGALAVLSVNLRRACRLWSYRARCGWPRPRHRRTPASQRRAA